VEVGATFRQGHRSVQVNGFYDGEGTYRVRFMPDEQGTWSYKTTSSPGGPAVVSGTFVCTPAAATNHGPVAVTRTRHFAYADGTPYLPFGTTCYVWNHQGESLEGTTLETLRHSPFNKIRMCLFPKHYLYNENEPPYHPFEPGPSGPDVSRFHPPFFHHLEQRIEDLRDLGIEADLILFHPYDRWGYATLGADADDSYLRYVVARLGAYRNVWWSLANEYDLMDKQTADWDRLFRVVQTSDPYGHPRSIHNCRGFYDHTRPWVTHASIQHSDLVRVTEWMEAYGKPIVVDECCYEGNIPRTWGNISAQEMNHRIWEGTLRGGHVGHGETYLDRQDILWWAKGGKLHGQSPPRIRYLRSVLAEAPPYLVYTDRFSRHYPALSSGLEYFLVYFGNRQPAEAEIPLPEGLRYTVDVIDTWEMRARRLPALYAGAARVPLPGKPYVALRLMAGETPA
jgi:hypothetical protein